MSSQNGNNLNILLLNLGGKILARPVFWAAAFILLAVLCFAAFAPAVQAQEVAADYTYEVADGQLTITLAQSDVQGWKVIEVRDKAHCDTTRFGSDETVVADVAEASQSVMITVEAGVNYCFWPKRQSDSDAIKYAYASARYIEQADPVSAEEIEADYTYRVERENQRLIVSLEQTGVIGWRVFKVGARGDCSIDGFSDSNKVVDNVTTSQSVVVEVESDVNYCFWARRQTDDVEANLFYFSADDISKVFAATPTTPPQQQPVTPPQQQPVTPPQQQQPGTTVPEPPPLLPEVATFEVVDSDQGRRDSKDVFEIVGNRDIASGNAVRLDKLEDGADCDQTAFADASLLHEDAEVGADAFYIILSEEDDGEEFCFQIKEDRDGQVSEAYGITDAAELEEDESGGGSVTTEPDEEDDEDEVTSTDDDDEQFEIGSSTLLAILIGAGVVGVLAIFFVIIAVSSKK